MTSIASAGTRPATAGLLWAACRPSPDLDAVRAAVGAGADLGLAAKLAVHQRVAGLLARGLTAAGVDLTAPWADDLRIDAARCRAHAVMVLARAGPLALQPLADAGLEVLTFKGAALAERYPAPGLRPMDDVDLVLPPAQHGEAMRVLAEAGWRVARPAGGPHYDELLVHPELPGLPLELHRALSIWQERASGLSLEALWGMRIPQTIFGAHAFGLPPEEELVAVAGHAGKPFHVFGRLLWSVDAVVIVQSAATASPVSWDRVARLADRLGSATALAVLLSQASRLGADVPGELCLPMARGTRRAALAPLFDPEWPALPRDKLRRRFQFVVADAWWRRAVMLAGAVAGEGVGAIPRRALDFGRAFGRNWVRFRFGRPGPR